MVSVSIFEKGRGASEHTQTAQTPMPKDYAREEAGSQIVMATCVDDRFPPENMLDGKESTFWVTTG